MKRRKYILRFNLQDEAIEEWLASKPNKGEYLKQLILADKARRQAGEEIRPLNAHDTAWESRYALVLEFLDRFGRLPYYYEEYRGVKLGRWLKEHARLDGESRPDRMEKLAQIGALDKWERFFAALKAFQEKFARFPKKDEFLGDIPVGAWLQRQRLAMRRGELPEEKKEKLLALGVTESDWEKKFELVVAFREEFGRLPKFEDTYRGVRIGRWLYAQRKTLDPVADEARIEKLRSIGALPFVRQKNVKKVKQKGAE